MPERPADPDASPTRTTLGDRAAPAAAERPSKTRRKHESHELQIARRGAARAPRRPARDARPRRAAARCAPCRTPHRSHEARRRQMQLIGKLMRAADVELARAAVAERQLGRARDSLALHQAERWRAELIADDAATTRFAARTPAPTCSSCARSCATRARTRRARPSSAAAAPTASCSSSSASTKAMADERGNAGARRPRPHRPGLGERPRVDRRLRGQGHPGAARLAVARAAQPDRLGDAPDRRRARRASARPCASSSTTRAATSCSRPAAPGRRRATSRPRRRSRSRPRRCPASASRCGASAWRSCRRRSCRARSRWSAARRWSSTCRASRRRSPRRSRACRARRRRCPASSPQCPTAST